MINPGAAICVPAAFSKRIGVETQRPLAIVIGGGMITTLFLTR
jgi:Cu/Ag efflux pump CusA